MSVYKVVSKGVFLEMACYSVGPPLFLIGYLSPTPGKGPIRAFIALPSHPIYVIMPGPQYGLSAIQGTYIHSASARNARD